MKRLVIAIAGLIVLAAVGLAAGIALAPQPTQQAWQALRLPPAAYEQLARRLPSWASPAAPAEGVAAPIVASGALEAAERAIAADPAAAGRVSAVFAAEGETVRAGQPLVQLDDSLLRAQLNEADQAVAAAQAAAAAAAAGPRPAQIAAAEANVQGAQAALAGAQQALADAQRAQQNPLELDAQIDSAAARVALARRQIDQARARQAAVAALRAGIAGDNSDQGRTQRAIYEKQEAAAAEAIAAAEQEAAGAQRALNLLRQMRADPVALAVQVRAAQEQVRLAEAALAVAQAELALAAAGPRPESVAVAEAQVAEAQAARDLLAAQLAKTSLVSPIDGLVTVRAVQPGEMAAPAAPLLKVADLTRMTLVVYVPLTRIGQVQVGQAAHVRVDAYPGRVFSGAVSRISPRAEFTPKNIQAPSERAETVFAVEITLDNRDAALKPGMPADAEILAAP